MGHALDDAILGFRTATQSPSYSRQILDGLGVEGGASSLRVLRTVERLAVNGRGPSIRLGATGLGVEHSTASRFVAGLVGGTLLVKETCGDNRRQARLNLAARGRVALDGATVRRRRLVAEVTDRWAREALVALTEMLIHLRIYFDRRFVRS